VFIPPWLMAGVYQWIKGSVSKKQEKDLPLFGIGQRRWSYILEKAGTKMFNRHINPHLLRHSCGTWLDEQGFPIKYIADYLGHSSINTTRIYAHTSQVKFKEMFKGIFSDGA